MISVLDPESVARRDPRPVVSDDSGRRVGTATERDGDLLLELAPDAPAELRALLDVPDDAERVRLDPRFVAERTADEIRLRA